MGSGLPPDTSVVRQEGIAFRPGIRTNCCPLSGRQVGPPSTGTGSSGRPFSLGQAATSAACSLERRGGRSGTPGATSNTPVLSHTPWREALLPGLPRAGARPEMGSVTKGRGLLLFLQPVPAPPPAHRPPPLRMFSGVSTKSLPRPLLPFSPAPHP